MKHTPTPMDVFDYSKEELKKVFRDSPETYEMVVRAVNMREELLESLKNVVARFLDRCVRTGANSAEELMLKAARQTIAKTEAL